VGDGLPSGDVLDNGSSSGQASCSDCDLDGVAGCESDTREIVRVVGIPFVPSVVGDRASGLRPVNTSLQDGSVASVAVDANPCGPRTGSGGSGDGESPGHALEAAAD
jgi:hypothetical protein